MIPRASIVSLLLDSGFKEVVKGELYTKEVVAGPVTKTNAVSFTKSKVTHSTWVSFWYEKADQSGRVYFTSPKYSTNLGTAITTTVR